MSCWQTELEGTKEPPAKHLHNQGRNCTCEPSLCRREWRDEEAGKLQHLVWQGLSEENRGDPHPRRADSVHCQLEGQSDRLFKRSADSFTLESRASQGGSRS